MLLGIFWLGATVYFVVLAYNIWRIIKLQYELANCYLAIRDFYRKAACIEYGYDHEEKTHD